MSFEFKLPDLGEGIREAEVLAVKVNAGQSIVEDQILFEVETDKAVVEIPSPVAGKVLDVMVTVGNVVPVGTVMISVEEVGGDQSAKVKNTTQAVKPEKANGRADSALQPAQADTNIAVVATPATRQLARELKIDLHKVRPSGQGGKITKEDVLAYSQSLKTNSNVVSEASTISGAPSEAHIALPDFSKFGNVERVQMRSLRRRTAQQMSLSWSKIPHVTHCDEANVSKLEKLRIENLALAKSKGAKLTLIAFVMKAVCSALQEFPEFNTSLDEKSEEIIFKRYYNLGMAVATDRGLMVPVLKSVDKKNIFDLALEINEIADKARSGKIELSELQGGTFTVTNIGIIGGTGATPIINFPEAAILATMRIVEKPVFNQGKIESGLILPLCLAFDHRITDGAEAAKFLRSIIEKLEKPESFAMQEI